MGGGGGGIFYNASKGIFTDELKNKAKESIKRTEKRIYEKKSFIYPTRNVFISFHTADEMQVKLLRYQAKDDRFNFKFRDYSIKEPFSERWKTQCKERIKKCSFTICLIGEKTHSRPAVLWELEQSIRMGKKVIGVRIYQEANHKIPKPLKDHNCKIIDWNLGDIMEQLSEE